MEVVKMWDIIILCISFGFLIGIAIPIMALIVNKKQYPYTYLNFEKRQGGYVCELLKGRVTRDKKGIERFTLKQTVIDSGIGALFGAQEIVANQPDKAMGVIKKSGGIMIVSNSPIANTFMPCNVNIVEDPARADIIVKDVDVRNWYKVTLEQQLKHALLNPKSFLGQHPEIKIIAAGIIFVMIMVIYTAMVHPILVQLMNAQSGPYTAFADAINNLASSVGGAANAVVIPGE
jgi:hypothetical protein